jgi:hypothetical protein
MWAAAGLEAGAAAIAALVAFVLLREAPIGGAYFERSTGAPAHAAVVNGSEWIENALAGAAIVLLLVALWTAGLGVRALRGTASHRSLRLTTVALIGLTVVSAVATYLRADSTGIQGAIWVDNFKQVGIIDLLDDRGPWIALPDVLLGATGGLLAGAFATAVLARFTRRAAS